MRAHHKLPWLTPTIATLAILLVTACGSDSNNDTGTNPPPDDDDDPEFTLPLDPGSVWTYQEVTTQVGFAGGDSATILVAAASEEMLLGDLFTCLMTDEDGVRDASYTCNPAEAFYLRQDGTEFFIVEGSILTDSDPEDPVSNWLIQTAQQSFPWKAGELGTEGTLWTIVDTETDLQTKDGPTHIAVTIVGHSLGMEAVDVPAGRYAGYRSRIIITANVESPAGNVTFRQTANYWFSDQIGMTRVHFRDEVIENGQFITEEVDTRLISWDLATP